MPSVLAYHRPGSLDEASALLAEPNRRLIGGGTVVVPESRVAREVGVELVDLQAVGLDALEVADGRVTIGAMARLGDLVLDERTPALLRDLCRRELPSALRNQATIGGTVALAEAESVLLAGLLVHAADVSIHGTGQRGLAAVLADGVGTAIVTSLTVEDGGSGAVASTGRTPADTPIVAAVARAHEGAIRLALTGVAEVPVLADPRDPTAGLDPRGDFRGSADYRLHLAATLAERAVREVAS